LQGEWPEIAWTRLIIVLLKCALDDPEKILDRVEEGAVGWQENDDQFDTPQEVHNISVSVNSGSIEDPNRIGIRVWTNASVLWIRKVTAVRDELGSVKRAIRDEHVENAIDTQKLERRLRW
jgi:hypothetical protein